MQDIKLTNRNLLHSYTLTTTKKEKSEREIKEIILFVITVKRIKYLGIKPPKEAKDLSSEKHNEKEQKWHKQMATYTMLLNGKDQYCEKYYTTKRNPKNQYNPYQIPREFFTE